MKWLKRIVLTLIVLFTSLFIVGLFLSREWDVVADIEIKAPLGEVFTTVADLSTWPEWTAWNTNAYPALTWEFSEENSGRGASMKWYDQHQHGQLTVVESVENRYISYDLAIGSTSSRGKLEFLSSNEVVTVYWRNWGVTDDTPWQNLMIRVITPLMEKDFYTGLQQLKKKVEMKASVTQ